MSGLSIEAQTGWKRPAPLSICQDIDVLRRVRVYDYDLENEDFLDYARSRIGCDPRNADCGYARAVEFDAMSAEAYRAANRYANFSHPVTGKRHKYFSVELDAHEICRQIQKAKFQDCWELFLAAEGLEAVS